MIDNDDSNFSDNDANTNFTDNNMTAMIILILVIIIRRMLC